MDHLLVLVVIIHSWMLMADVHSFLAIHELLCFTYESRHDSKLLGTQMQGVRTACEASRLAMIGLRT